MRRFFPTGGLLVCLAVLLLEACGQEAAGPDLSRSPEITGRAIALYFDLAAGSAVQLDPLELAVGGGLRPRFALIGSHEAAASVSHVTRTAASKGRVRVRFDLALTNQLENADLVPSTFPLPPRSQVVAFPFTTDPAGLFGLKVIATSDWDGEPWNFFNDAICIAAIPPSDCYRWEPFGATIAAGATSAKRQVGFDVDATVTSFTVYVAIAADIHERPAPPVIGVSEASLVFSSLVGAGPIASRDIQVSNVGGGTLTGLDASVSYLSGQPEGWLSATLNSPTAPAQLALQPSVGVLAPGVYLATVTLTAAGAANSPLSISVGLVVAQPEILVSVSHVDAQVGYHGQPAIQVIQVTSASGVPISDLTASIVYGGGQPTGWLNATLSGNTTPATLTLTETPGDLLPGGLYFAEVDVKSPSGDAQPITVRLNVYQLPDLTFTGSADVAMGTGSITVTNLAVVNQGTLDAGAYNVGFCLSTTTSISDCIPGLEAFLTRTGLAVSGVDNLPALQVQAGPGLYHVIAVVDPPYTAMVTESDETNNVLDLGEFEIPAPSP